MDDAVLPYFMEYMQKQNATNLLNFWLTAETFRLSTINRLRINSRSRLKTSKAGNAYADLDVNSALATHSDAPCTTSSFEELNSLGHSKGVENQQQCLDNDNEFGDFTGYEPENSMAPVSSGMHGADGRILCDKGGHFKYASSSNEVQQM